MQASKFEEALLTEREIHMFEMCSLVLPQFQTTIMLSTREEYDAWEADGYPDA